MRDLPKLLGATLATLFLALGPAAGSASARHGDGHSHAERHQRAAARHAAREEARAKRRAAHEEARARRRAAREEARAKRRAAREHPEGRRQARADQLAAREREREQRLTGRKTDGAATAAASIAAVLATPCQDTGLTPTPGNQSAVRAAVLCLINRVRAEHGLQPLAPNAQLEAAAEGHCSELVADDYFAHVSPSGETPVERIKDTGYIPNSTVGYVIGENLAWGTYSLATPAAIVEAWVASPGHLANILESRYTETGIGVAPAVPETLGEGNPGGTYAEEFGVIVR